MRTAAFNWSSSFGIQSERVTGTDPEQLALGELQEETGYKATALHKLGHLFQAHGYSNQGYHVFLAMGMMPGKTRRDVEEQDMLTAAFTRPEINSMIQSGQIKEASTIASLGLLVLSEFG